MSPDPLTYSVEQAAAALGTGRDRVLTLVRTGDLPHLRFGRTIRIPRAALAEWVNDQAQATARQRQAL